MDIDFLIGLEVASHLDDFHTEMIQDIFLSNKKITCLEFVISPEHKLPFNKLWTDEFLSQELVERDLISFSLLFVGDGRELDLNFYWLDS